METPNQETSPQNSPPRPESDGVLFSIAKDVATIQLADESEKVAILTRERLEAFDLALSEIEKRSSLKGLVIRGPHPRNFCAGANIKEIEGITDPKEGEKLARQGQKIFDRLEKLPCVTVAAISGPCMGGGCEMVLACNYRVFLGTPKTKIGLPEIRLGILPGFGGTQRLPRLIGVKNALDIILKGKTVSPQRALSLGLGDKVIEGSANGQDAEKSFEHLLEVARGIASGEDPIAKRRPSITDLALTYSGIGRTVVQTAAKRGVLNETKGKYPAPLAALDCVFYGLKNGLEEGLREEAKRLGELIVTSESKALVHLFYLTEEANKLGKVAKGELSDARVGIVGAGVMGSGIAATFLKAGVPVVVVEPDEEARSRARARIEKSLERSRSLSPTHRLERLKKLHIASEVSAVSSATLVVEAVFEDFELKKKIFKQISDVVDEKAIIASNTSSLPITNLEGSVKNPERVVGMHFFNPVEKMPLIGVIRSKSTGNRALAYTAGAVSLLNKYPVVVEDVSGFLINRILSPYLVEAAALLSEGYTIQEIDKAATDFGMPMGPLRLLDEIGLDVAAKVALIIERSYGSRMQGPRFAEELVAKGRLGKKSGLGFYKHSGKDAHIDPEIPFLLGIHERPERGEQFESFLADRLILALVNEAVRCLDEGVAGAPGREAAGQIDLATVMGTGFAPFRGGILFYAELRGAKEIVTRLEEFEAEYGERFSPCDGLLQRAKTQGSFYSSLSVQ